MQFVPPHMKGTPGPGQNLAFNDAGARGGSIARRRPVAYVEFASAIKNLTSYHSSSQQDTS
jgi:hypothetical protein